MGGGRGSINLLHVLFSPPLPLHTFFLCVCFVIRFCILIELLFNIVMHEKILDLLSPKLSRESKQCRIKRLSLNDGAQFSWLYCTQKPQCHVIVCTCPSSHVVICGHRPEHSCPVHQVSLFSSFHLPAICPCRLSCTCAICCVCVCVCVTIMSHVWMTCCKSFHVVKLGLFRFAKRFVLLRPMSVVAGAESSSFSHGLCCCLKKKRKKRTKTKVFFCLFLF